MPENNFISALRGYLRLGNFPLDASSVYDNFLAASEYASSNPTAYAGQLVAVVDEVTRTVTIYQLGYKVDPAETGYELQSLSTSGSGGVVKTVNNISPDDNGNVQLSFDILNDILYFIQDTETGAIFNKPILLSDPNSQIVENNSVITKGYLEGSLDNYFSGVSRTFNTTFTGIGGITTNIIPGGSIIKKITLDIIQPFQVTDITVSIAGITLLSPADIYETEISRFISEPYITLPGTAANEYPIEILTDGSPSGSAELYIDFNISFTK